jgi:hypothetical protein
MKTKSKPLPLFSETSAIAKPQHHHQATTSVRFNGSINLIQRFWIMRDMLASLVGEEHLS